MKKYYPAIFHAAEEGGFWVDFPDLDGCFTQGETLEESKNMAFEALNEYLIALQAENAPIPEPSKLETIKVKKDDYVTLIETDTIKYKKEIGTLSVKKTLTIPGWLNSLAKEKKINFSQVFQAALKKELGLN
ncbi:MAG: type II toxin-antitoxin system HicB family antitoxin [Fusobacteriaceae bacterium]|jgi:predicted RNase H-like HicB family nuclease|nr:type II toxin-antitoxin system HicB family antitoxin [Fusobacteriaceae bacterium]